MYAMLPFTRKKTESSKVCSNFKGGKCKSLENGKRLKHLYFLKISSYSRRRSQYNFTALKQSPDSRGTHCCGGGHADPNKIS
jgi:hypothetical protein